ncbi:MAG: hypothetical protein K2O34_05855 [Acetatifactor sp.]|nr:hypothetical protein [Acetatifactor sp.]
MLGTGDKIIIGYDLGNVFSQISYAYLSQDSEVETLSSVAGEEYYNIPTALCKRSGTGQWFFGREALRFAQDNPEEAIVVDNLVELALAGEQVLVDGESYEPVALLTLFIKRSLGLLSLVSAPEKIVAMMITCRKLDSGLIDVLNRTVTGLGLGFIRVYYQSYAESFYDYMLYQPRDLWVYQTVLLDYREEGIYGMRMECNKRTTPIVAYVHQRTYPFSGESCLPDISSLDEGRLQQLDQQLLQIVSQECENRTVSSVYLIGESVAETWMSRSLRYLCKERRVFQGVNLYSKGAVYCLMDKHFGSKAGKEYVFLGEDKLKYNIGMNVLRQGEESYYALLDAGENWYDSVYSCEFYVRLGRPVPLVITPLITGGVSRLPLSLGELPQSWEAAGREGYSVCELARIRMNLHLEGERLLCVELEDMGFGEIRPATELSWHQKIICGDGRHDSVPEATGVMTCVGDYAEEPYVLPKLGLRVYCIEELCYCLKENAFLLDAGIMNDGLLDFIRKDCQLPGLAQTLHPLVHQQGALSGFVSRILAYVGLYDMETLQQVEETLKAGSGLSDYEKQKLQTDRLAEQKRYEEALKAYDRLLEQIRENQEMEVPALQALTADILHNKGVVYARQMLYGQAAELLYQAWRISGGREDYFADYLAACRMQLPEQDYVALAAEYPDQYQVSLKVEQTVEIVEQLWRDTPEYKRLMQLRARRLEGDIPGYCEENDRILQTLRNDYRRGSFAKKY